VTGYLVDHVTAHLVVPDGLGRVELAQVDLGEALVAVVLQVADHGLGEYVAEDRALHYVISHFLGVLVVGAKGLLEVGVFEEAAYWQDVTACVH